MPASAWMRAQATVCRAAWPTAPAALKRASAGRAKAAMALTGFWHAGDALIPTASTGEHLSLLFFCIFSAIAAAWHQHSVISCRRFTCLCSDGDVCSACVDDMSLDPGTGLCGPCQVGPAQPRYCTHEDRTRCINGLCSPGFYCHNATGQCTSCPFKGCFSCDDDADECSACMPGFWDTSQPIRDEQYRASTDWDNVENLPIDCQPCIDDHCLVCDNSYGAACEMCSDGYFLDRQTKRCRSVGATTDAVVLLLPLPALFVPNAVAAAENVILLVSHPCPVCDRFN